MLGQYVEGKHQPLKLRLGYVAIDYLISENFDSCIGGAQRSLHKTMHNISERSKRK